MTTTNNVCCKLCYRGDFCGNPSCTCHKSGCKCGDLGPPHFSTHLSNCPRHQQEGEEVGWKVDLLKLLADEKTAVADIRNFISSLLQREQAQSVIDQCAESFAAGVQAERKRIEEAIVKERVLLGLLLTREKDRMTPAVLRENIIAFFLRLLKPETE